MVGFAEVALRQALGLEHTTGKRAGSKAATDTQPIELFMCSIVKRAGYADGFKLAPALVQCGSFALCAGGYRSICEAQAVIACWAMCWPCSGVYSVACVRSERVASVE